MNTDEFRGWLMFIIVATTVIYLELVTAIDGFLNKQLVMVVIARHGFAMYVMYALWQGNAFAKWLIIGSCLIASAYGIYICSGNFSANLFVVAVSTVYFVMAITLSISQSFESFLKYQRDEV